MRTLADRIRFTREQRGLSQAQLAKSAGLANQSIIGMLESGDRKRSSHLPAIARTLGVDVLWLQYGDSAGTQRAQAPVEPGDARLPVRRVLFRLSAGVSGYEIEYEDGESEPIFMARRWFDQHGYRPGRLLAIKVTGRSMEPSLYDGDLVIVNLDDTRLQDGQVFAANYEGELVIKRLKRDAQQWFLSSDSPDKIRFGDKRCTDGCGLIGRIVYRQTEHI
jgi:SOS-response transcriptional repressor LexA